MTLTLKLNVEKPTLNPCEHSSVDKNLTYYIQENVNF